MMELEQILTYCDHTLLKPEAKASGFCVGRVIC